MLAKLRFIKDPLQKAYSVEVRPMSGEQTGLIQVISIEAPAYAGGFKLYNDNNKESFDFSNYKTIYQQVDGAVLYSADGSVYSPPVQIVRFMPGDGGIIDGLAIQEVLEFSEIKVPDVKVNPGFVFKGWEPKVPTRGQVKERMIFNAVYDMVEVPKNEEFPNEPIRKTLQQVQEEKIAEFNAIQQKLINDGTDVMLSNGTVEHFTATDADQRSLAALQAQVLMGTDKIPWHSNDKMKGCVYYSNEDMRNIIETVTGYVTYHVTYFRDLRKMVLCCTDAEICESYQYGMVIPKVFRSEVLNDLYAAMAVRPEPPKFEEPTLEEENPVEEEPTEDPVIEEPIPDETVEDEVIPDEPEIPQEDMPLVEEVEFEESEEGEDA